MQFFAVLHKHQHLRPDLADVLLGEFPGVLCAAARRFDRPEPAVACGVPQIAGLGVGGAKEDTLSRMRRRTSAERGSVDIILPGKEGTQRLHLGFAKPRQLTDLQNPIALQLLGSGLVLGVAQVQTVGEPLSGKAGDEGRLADALGTV